LGSSLFCIVTPIKIITCSLSTPPLLFTALILFEKLDLKNKASGIILACLLLYANGLLALNLLGFIVDLRDGTAITLKSESDIALVTKMRELGNGYGLFAHPWIYLFADIQPEISLVPAIYNSKYIGHEDFFAQTGLVDLHNNLLSNESMCFLMNKGNLNNPTSLVAGIIG
jgi:hypothetical protein